MFSMALALLGFIVVITGFGVMGIRQSLYSKEPIGFPVRIFPSLAYALFAGTLLVSGWLPPNPVVILICVGMFVVLLGDYLLNTPGDNFIFGLLAFFVAYSIFIVAFNWDLWSGAEFTQYAFIVPFFIVATISILIYQTLDLSPQPLIIRGAVIVYFIMQTTLVALTAHHFWNIGGDLIARNALLIVGTIAFYASDAIIAVQKFGTKKIEHYLGEWLISLLFFLGLAMTFSVAVMTLQ